MFRLVERWRATHQTSDVLFEEACGAQDLACAMTTAAEEHLVLHKTREYLEMREQVAAVREISTTLAGTIFVTLNNTLQRFRKDLGASSQDCESHGPLIQGLVGFYRLLGFG
jgi:hypothetical protein